MTTPPLSSPTDPTPVDTPQVTADAGTVRTPSTLVVTTATDALPPVPTASGALGTRTSTAYVEADEPVVLVGSNATCETVPSISGMPVTVTRAACPTAIAARLAAGTWMVTFAAPDPTILYAARGRRGVAHGLCNRTHPPGHRGRECGGREAGLGFHQGCLGVGDVGSVGDELGLGHGPA